MASAKIFRINYKSDFILTLESDAGWMTPFCIKFWTGAPSQAYYVGWDGETYTHCAYDPSEPTKLLVQFDDHHLPIGDLKFQIAYHFTVADFPNNTEDEVINPANITTEIDGETYQVMLDFTGETAPEIQFALPAYANEAQRIANEEQRIAHEAIRIVNEESRIAAETIRQQNEAQRIAQETARVNEFATLKSQSQAATRDANDAATLANQKAQLAADKAALAQAAADLANAKAQLAADKAALAASAAQLANDKAALAQQKAEYAHQQGGYAKDQGDYAKDQGDYAKAQGDTALSDHQRAEADHGIAVDDHTQAGNDHTRAESDHGIAADDHTQAGNDHTRAESDHGIAADDHTQAGNDHTRAESDHGIAADDHTQAGNDHTRAESDHTRAESDHAAVEVYVDSLGVFDLSKHNAVGGFLATYADLSAALTALNALDSQYKYGGMSFKFVQTSDNLYVQFRYMDTDATTNSKFTNVANWQGVDTEPIAGSRNLVESSGMVVSGGAVFSITGDGTTVVHEDNALKGLTIGKKYRLYAKKWSMSEMSDSQNVIQLYFIQEGTQLVEQVTKANMPDILVIDFTAVISDYRINFRGNSGTVADFKIREYDDTIDKPIMDLTGSVSTLNTQIAGINANLNSNLIPIIGKATSSKDVNKIVLELYSISSAFINNASFITKILLSTLGDGRKQIVFTYSDSTNNGFTLEEKANGVYQMSYSNAGTYVYVKNWRNTDNLNATIDTDRLVSLSANPVISGYLAKEYIQNNLPTELSKYQEMRNFSITGNGSTLVQSLGIIDNLTIGVKYSVFTKIWNVPDRTDNQIVFQLYYTDAGGTNHVAKQYFKRDLVNYVYFDFVAESKTYNINFYGQSDISVPFYLCSYGAIIENILSMLYLQNETIRITGNGSSVVEKPDIIKGLVPGETYQLFAQKWSMSEMSDSKNVIQLYYDNPPVVIRQIKKSECPDYIDIEFTAVTESASINLRADSGVVVPLYITKKINRLDHRIDKIESKVGENYWNGKSLAWYGTSIPEGSSTNNYPKIVGTLLKSIVYNYAKGSSGVVKGGNSYLSYDRNMGHTIAEKIAAVQDMWTIDDANQTFTNGPRTMGISGIPEYTTYAQVVAARLSIITASYEVILLVRTLLSDATERTTFLQNALGELYTQMMTAHASSFAYHDIDLWVLDHGHNDNCGTDPSQIDMSQVNLTSFVGAMNYYIGLIYQYKNHPRIVIVSDYDNFNNYGKKYTIQTQQAIADRWHLPIIRIDKYLPFNIDTTIKTRGYWDSGAQWHNTGFVWNGDIDNEISIENQMVGNAHLPAYVFYNYTDARGQAKTKTEIATSLGLGSTPASWYEIPPRYIWLFDGLHPASVIGGEAVQMYAEPMAKLLEDIGTNGGY